MIFYFRQLRKDFLSISFQGKGYDVRIERSALHDNWDDAEGYYSKYLNDLLKKVLAFLFIVLQMFDILAPNVKLYMALPVVIGSLLPHPHLTFYSPMSMFLFLCSASILFFHHFIEVTNEGNWHLNSPRMVKQNFPICTIVVQLAVSDIFLMSNCMFLLVDPILLLLKIGIDSYTSSIFPGR